MENGDGNIALLVIAWTLIILVFVVATQAHRYWRNREKKID